MFSENDITVSLFTFFSFLYLQVFLKNDVTELSWLMCIILISYVVAKLYALNLLISKHFTIHSRFGKLAFH